MPDPNRIALNKVYEFIGDQNSGHEFHPKEIATETGYGMDTIRRILIELSQRPIPLVRRSETRGWWVVDAKVGNPVPGTLAETDLGASAINRDPGARDRPEVIGFTPQGDLVTRDPDGSVIRIWIPAEHSSGSYRYGE